MLYENVFSFFFCMGVKPGVLDSIKYIKTNLVTVQLDEIYSVYYISVGSSTCFDCWHPSSGAGTTVIAASGID